MQINKVSQKDVYTHSMNEIKVKLSRYTPWRHIGGEEV
jgi:hypothetical protein